MKSIKTSISSRLAALITGAALFGLISQSALAANTASNTTISNSATVNYSVGATAQPAITSAAAQFVVDNKVDVTVTKTADASVIPGTTKQALAFDVLNAGNTTQRYALSAVAGASTLTNPIASTSIYLDVNNDKAWDAGDTLYVDAGTFLDVPAGNTLHVLIVADIPSPETNGQTAVYSLLATTVDAGLLTVTAAGGANGAMTVEAAFADIAGTADVANDGKHSASATYTISAALLTVTKTAAVYSDPVNGVSATAKAIPGAVVTYSILIANAAGGATATSVSISDDLATEIGLGHLAYATQFTDAANACGAGQGIVVAGGGEIAGGVCKTNALDVEATTSADFNATAVNKVTVTGLSIAGGTSATIKFQVVVQ